MNYLSCNVESCIANKQGGCCLHSIKVEGPAANTSKETVCGSYQSKKGAANGCGSNKYDEVNGQVEVGCSAVVCTYNQSGKCEAQKVEIACNCGCGDRSECATFKV